MPTAPVSPAAEQLPTRTAAVWAALDPLVTAGTPLRVLDLGGGGGRFAVPLARLGHEVTVVDPSADALATLRRRAETAGVGERVRGLQGDGDRLHELRDGADASTPLDSSRLDSSRLDSSPFDLALCHSVLEVVDDPAVTLREISTVLRSGGTLSVAVPNQAGAVLARALGGHPGEALALFEGRDPAAGPGRPARRQFTPASLLDLLESAGLRPGHWRGVSVVADQLDSVSEASPAACRSLELALAEVSPYRDVAVGVHVLATRP